MTKEEKQAKLKDIQEHKYDPTLLRGKQPQWHRYSKATERAMDAIVMGGVNSYTESQLKSIIYAMARTANNRIKALEREGYSDSPALRKIKRESYVLSGSNEGLKHQTLKHKAYVLADFLENQTSTVEGYKEFLNKTINKWIGENATQTEREAVWDLYDRLRPFYSSYFTLDYSSGELAMDISDFYQVLSKNQFDVDVAFEKLTMTLQQIEEENGIIREEFGEDEEIEQTNYEKFIIRATAARKKG